MKKKIISLALALITLLSIGGSFASARSITEGFWTIVLNDDVEQNKTRAPGMWINII